MKNIVTLRPTEKEIQKAETCLLNGKKCMTIDSDRSYDKIEFTKDGVDLKFKNYYQDSEEGFAKFRSNQVEFEIFLSWQEG